MRLQLEFVVFLVYFLLSLNVTESSTSVTRIEEGKSIFRSVRAVHRRGGKGKKRHPPPPRRPPCFKKKRCPKRPKKRPPPPPKTSLKQEVNFNSTNVFYHTAVNNYYHWNVPPFWTAIPPPSSIPVLSELSTSTSETSCTGSPPLCNYATNNTVNRDESHETSGIEEIVTATSTTTKMVETTINMGIPPPNDNTTTTIRSETTTTKLPSTTPKPPEIDIRSDKEPDSDDVKLVTSPVKTTPITARKLPPAMLKTPPSDGSGS